MLISSILINITFSMACLIIFRTLFDNGRYGGVFPCSTGNCNNLWTVIPWILNAEMPVGAVTATSF